jgi:Tol biopolymer transport system component
MNKELLDQIPVDEQPAASKLYSAAEYVRVPLTFEWQLETQLMDAYKTKKQPRWVWHAKIIRPLGWAILAIWGVFLLSWTLRSLIPNLSAASGVTPTPNIPFDAKVRQGNICAGPLAVAHDFSVSLTDQNKTGFVILDEQQTIGELRSFAWSPDGQQVAIVGNTTGRGNIYLTDSTGSQLQPVLSNSDLGYLMAAAWSRDGKRLITWSIENNTIVYLVNADGTGLVEIQLGMQFFVTPQFAPDNGSIIFYGADSSADGLFEARLDGSQITMISDLVEDETGFAWSPDGSRLAYMEMDRNLGEARLVVEKFEQGGKDLISSLPIPKGSGSSIPESANLSWSWDGKAVVFEFGRGMSDRAIYLAYTDGSGIIKLADSARTPAISPDGNCMAYISDKQVFLMDLTNISLTSTTATPLLLGDLPVGRSIADFRLDKLQWGSEKSLSPK